MMAKVGKSAKVGRPAEAVADAILFGLARPPGVVVDTIDLYPESPLGRQGAALT